MNNKKKVIIYSVSIVVVVVFAIGFYGWYHHNSAMKIANKHSRDRYLEIERSYIERPNIDDAFKLIDRFYYLEAYDKALLYANECIRLGVNDTHLGYLVNFQMANIYNRIGQTEKASTHLKKAIELDREERIKNNNWIEKEGLSHLMRFPNNNQ